MAVVTLAAQLTLVNIIRLVTAHTVNRRTLKDTLDVALFTCHALVLTGQFKKGLFMVKYCRLPLRAAMTNSTFPPKSARVMIVLLVAAIAINRRPFQDLINVTFLARQAFMLAAQLKDGQVVIKPGWLPTLWRMAVLTPQPERTLVTIIFQMTT